MTAETNAIAVRRLGPDEWPLNKQLRLAALADAPYAFTTTFEQAQARTDADWQRINTERETFAAIAGGAPAGMFAFAMSDDEPHVAGMFAVWVGPEFRRTGVGAAMIEHAAQLARERNATILRVGVYDVNPGALRFYLACGFHDTGEREPMPRGSVLTLDMKLDE